MRLKYLLMSIVLAVSNTAIYGYSACSSKYLYLMNKYPDSYACVAIENNSQSSAFIGGTLDSSINLTPGSTADVVIQAASNGFLNIITNMRVVTGVKCKFGFHLQYLHNLSPSQPLNMPSVTISFSDTLYSVDPAKLSSSCYMDS